MRTAALLGLIVSALACATVPAYAHEVSIRGLVLAVLSARHQLVLRYETPLSHAPAIARLRVDAPSRLSAIRIGSTIVGTVDLDAMPWTVRDVRVAGPTTPLTDAPAGVANTTVLRNVHHLSVGESVPATAFVDQRGRRFSLRDFRGRTLALAFIYTRCRDARECPLISSKFLRLQEQLRGQPVHLVEVSLDPAYDTPAVLARYGRTFGADPSRWSLATGDANAVLNFAAQFDVTAFPDPRIGLIHAERTVIVDQYGTIRDLIDESSWSPDELIAAMNHDRRLASNPFERLNLWLSAAAVAVCGNSVAGFSGFLDLLVVIGIVLFFGFVFWRLGLAIRRGAT